MAALTLRADGSDTERRPRRGVKTARVRAARQCPQGHGKLAQFVCRVHLWPPTPRRCPSRNTFSRSMVSALSQPAQEATANQDGSFMPTIALVDDDRNILTSV